MAYSRAYQTVTAGRVREDEAIPFFGSNQIATPARISTITSVGGKKQPTVDTNYLHDTGVGKKTEQHDPLKDAYNPGSYNS